MDMAALASQLVPYPNAAIGAHGAASAAKTHDAIANETVVVGRRLLQRILKREQSRAQIQSAINDLAQAQPDSGAENVAVIGVNVGVVQQSDNSTAPR